jgi:hypothetical protein
MNIEKKSATCKCMDIIEIFPVTMTFANGEAESSTGFALSIGEREYLFNQFAEIAEHNNADETRTKITVERGKPELVTVQELAFDFQRCIGSACYLIRTHK